MPKSTPLRVTPTTEGNKRRSSKAPWVVEIGDSNRDISGHNTKKSAIGFAEMKAHQHIRPGVIVETKGGDYQKFVPNDHYWRYGEW